MLRTIMWYSNFAGSLLLKVPQMYKVKRLQRKPNKMESIEYIHNVTSKWAMRSVKVSGAKVNVYGLENIPPEIPVVFVSNHQGNFDTALFMSYINKPKGYIAKIEMKKVPIISTWMEYMNCVFMDRSNLRKSAQAIIEGIKILKSGHSLVIFPEGTRSKGGPVGEFKAGSFKLATKAKVPIIPVTIDGSYKLMEKNKNRIKPGEVNMYIHPMINTSELTSGELKELPVRVKDIICSKLK